MTNPDGTLFRICHFDHSSENMHNFTSCNKHGVVCKFGFIGTLNEESFSRCFYDEEMRELIKRFYIGNAELRKLAEKFYFTNTCGVGLLKKTCSDETVASISMDSDDESLNVYSHPNNTFLDSIVECTLGNYMAKMEFVLSAVYGDKMWSQNDYD